MELKQLTDLGVSEEIAKKVLEINTKEVSDEQSLTAAETAKLTAANTTIQDLTGKVKAFDGVDVDGLKKSAGEWETKYNSDLAALKLENAVNLALVGAGAKNAGLVKTLVDLSKVKLDGDKLLGFDEQLADIKAKNDYLFAADDPNDTGLRVNTGADHKDPPTDDKPVTLEGAVAEHYSE